MGEKNSQSESEQKSEPMPELESQPGLKEEPEIKSVPDEINKETEKITDEINQAREEETRNLEKINIEKDKLDKLYRNQKEKQTDETENNPSVHEVLNSWVQGDSKIADVWKKYMEEARKRDPEDYLQVAQDNWLKDHPEFSKENQFGRSEWNEEAKQYILKNLDEIFGDTGNNWEEPSDLLLAHHIIHHMDHDLVFQKEMLEEFERRGLNNEDHPNYEQYQFLYDRVAVNSGLPQKYNTQGDRGLEGHVNPF